MTPPFSAPLHDRSDEQPSLFVCRSPLCSAPSSLFSLPSLNLLLPPILDQTELRGPQLPSFTTTSSMDEEVAELSVDTMLEIISRNPIKFLARFKCVSKEWCKLIDNLPHLGITHTEEEPIPLQFCLDLTMETHDPKNNLIFEYVFNRRVIKFPSLPHIESWCYGLLLFRIKHEPPNPISYIVTHPLRKENYELPPVEMTTPLKPKRTVHGLGFDHSTNTFKIVKVLLMTELPIKDLDLVRQKSRAMVHVVGTRSWREIPSVPSYPLDDEAIFAHGFVYWFTRRLDVQGGQTKVICFEIAKEEFGSINHPPKTPRNSITYFERPFNLNGDLGVAYDYLLENFIEVWVMKDNVWKIHCQIDGGKLGLPRRIGYVGVWNKEGDILVKSHEGFFVFGLTTGVRQINDLIVDVEGYAPQIRMYTLSLYSINPFTRKSNPPC